jgi:surfactin synthase thioesterase subunit
VLEHEALMAVMLARLRHALALIERHRAPAQPALRCPATLIYGDRDALASKDDVLRWRGWLDPAESLAVGAGGGLLADRETEIVAAVGAAANAVLQHPAG